MGDSIDRSDPRHVYQQAADIVRDRIRAGIYEPGQDIPSMAKLGKKLGISELTMERAFYQLRDQGWLVVRQGYPTQVAAQLPTASTHSQLLAQARDLAERAARLAQALEAAPQGRQ